MSPDAQPGVAVVVPTHNRHARLRHLLDSLAEQTVPPDEVVVVDDGSRPAAAPVLAEFAGRLPLRALRHDRPAGPARARNAGWRAAGSELVAFIDDDCRADPGWVAALRAASARADVVVGRTDPDPRDGPIRSPIERSMRVAAEDGRFSTCNILYPRALLAALDGFDESFSMPYGEDTDLGQRALAQGASAAYAPDALVLHAVHRPGLRAALRERRRIGEMAGLMRRHPRLRDSGEHEGIWLTRDHRLATLAGAGLCILPLTPVGLVYAGAWGAVALRHRVPEWPESPAWRTLALLAVTDLVEVLACVDGSIRHRTLLL